MEKSDSTLSEEVVKQSDPVPEVISDDRNLESKDTHLELSEFSKRYSIAGRKKIAEEIRELRFQYFKKEKGNPERQSVITEQEKSIELLQKEKDEIEEEIKALEDEVEQRKARLWHRISSIFRRMEIEQELHIEPKKKKLEELKRDIEDRFKIISETESIILDTSSLEEAKINLNGFYKEQSDLKSTFENEERSRDVETLSKEKSYIFLHGIPTKNRGMNNTAENNPALNTTAMSTEDKLALLVGLEPTIAVSIIKEGQKEARAFYSFGVIIGGGKILSAYKEDSGTLAESLYSRRSKYDKETKTTGIQPDIEKHLDEAVNAPVESRNWGKYNEIVVERPKVAGLYINLSQFSDQDGLGIVELQKYATEMNLPVYALKDGKIYPFDLLDKIGVRESGQRYQKEDAFEVSGSELSLQEVIDNRREIDQEEKARLATSVVENNPFRVHNKPDLDFFGAYSRGTYTGVYDGRKGYERLLIAQKRHKEITAVGIEESDPGTSEMVLVKILDHLEDLKKRTEDATSHKARNFLNQNTKKELFSLYGFALNAKENGDVDIFNKAKSIIEKYGSYAECEGLIAKREDEGGNFRTLDIDVPIEIRQKMLELEK